LSATAPSPGPLRPMRSMLLNIVRPQEHRFAMRARLKNIH
jgi:hypothetical protein